MEETILRPVIGILFFGIIIMLIILLKDKKDLFSPRNIIPILYIIEIGIPVLNLSINSQGYVTNKKLIYNAINSDKTFYKFLMLELIYYIVLMCTVYVLTKKNKPISESIDTLLTPISANLSIKKLKLKFWAMLFFLIGSGSFIILMIKLGGISFFLNNLQYRTILMRDYDFLGWMTSLISFAPLLLLYSKKFEKSNSKLSIGFLIFTFIIGLINGRGGRKAIIVLFVQLIILWNYSIKKIEIIKYFKFKYVLISIISMASFIILPMLRLEGQLDIFINNPTYLFNEMINSVSELAIKESYVPFFILAVDKFNSSNYWLGKSFAGLITAFIPSSLFPNKPPIDDGMYLYSISLGRADIEPIMATSALNTSSFPLETFGSMYINFGITGIVLGSILLGCIISYFYNNMKRKNYSFLSVLLYIDIVINFELSTLRIMQFLTYFILTFLVDIIVNRLVWQKREMKAI